MDHRTSQFTMGPDGADAPWVIVAMAIGTGKSSDDATSFLYHQSQCPT